MFNPSTELPLLLNQLDADALNNVAGLHLHLRALTRAAEKGGES